MANIGTETPGLSDSTSREDSGGVESEEVRLDVTSTTVPHKVPETIDAVENVTEGTEILSVQSDSPRPTIITAVASGSTSSTGLSAPHPKKFSAVNINKKFLQKNSSPISSSPTSANTSSLKSGAPARTLDLHLYVAQSLCPIRSSRKTNRSSFGVTFTPRHCKAHCDSPTFNYHWSRLVSTFISEPFRLSFTACTQSKRAECHFFSTRGATTASCRKGDTAPASSHGHISGGKLEEGRVGEARVGQRRTWYIPSGRTSAG